MDLVPMAGAADSSSSSPAAARNLEITPEGRIVANVATVAAGYRSFGSTMEMPASVDFNEGTHQVVSARFGGRIERLFVRETGQLVRKGDPIMEIYSPELLAAQKDYLLAHDVQGLHTMSMGSGDANREQTAQRSERLLGASRKRLELLGMSAEQIRALDVSGEIAYSTRVYSTASGVVLKRAVTEGAYVNEGTLLLELADLSSVWVLADVYESDAYRVRPGMAMMVSGAALGGERRAGRIEYIYPTVDPASRTVRVRAAFANAGMLLKPGMYLTATIDVATKEALAVPAGAVVRTGARDLVYVEVAPNTFEPREVKLGMKDGDYYQIVSGALNAGDKVVAEGGFLLDSESQLRGVAGAGAKSAPPTSGAGAPEAKP
jgi:Cu(I)/Ag(I) efflux system membrane fusion protein